MAHDIKKFGEDMLVSQIRSVKIDMAKMEGRATEAHKQLGEGSKWEEALEKLRKEYEGLENYLGELVIELGVRMKNEKVKVANQSMAKTRARAESKAKA